MTIGILLMVVWRMNKKQEKPVNSQKKETCIQV